MTPRTLRRKLQKKAKRNRYGRCPVCGDRTRKWVGQYMAKPGHDDYDPNRDPSSPALYESCGGQTYYTHFIRELFWTGKPD